MKITQEEKDRLEEIYQTFLHDEKILRMKNIPMHRGSNCYLHSFKVAKLAIKNGLRHRHVSLETILIASILHDYYLYDWRKDKSKRKGHGRNHPFIAAKLAEDDFHISEEIKEVIHSHMWPINFKVFPKTKEARIVNIADTIVATIEAISSKRYKAKREAKYYAKISRLFDK